MRNLVKILLSLIAVYLFARYAVGTIVNSLIIQIIDGDYSIFILLFPLLGTLSFITASLILWIFSEKISNIVCIGTNDTMNINLNFNDIYIPIISIAGLILVVISLLYLS